MTITEQTNDTIQAQTGVRELFAIYNRYFHIPDEIGFTIIIASAVAHCITGEMLWVRIYGGSRSGKTEILRAIAEHEDSAKMEVITPASIRGGLTGGTRLLERIDGKLVITKDLAAMLVAHTTLRNEVFGLLRNVKDGELVSDFGTEQGHLHRQVKFDWLIGTMPVFAQYRAMEDLLGSRFVDLKWTANDREEMTLRALENDSNLPTIRREMAVATGNLINECKLKPIPELDNTELGIDVRGLIVDLANYTARLRTPVARDIRHRVKFFPEPEVGTSLAQNLARVTIALMLLGVTNPTRYLVRLCLGSIPYHRIKLLSELMKGEVRSTNRNWFELDDLELLGICEHVGEGYRLKEDVRNVLRVLFFFKR